MLSSLFSWSGGGRPHWVPGKTLLSCTWWPTGEYSRKASGCSEGCRIQQSLFRLVRLFQVLPSSDGNGCISSGKQWDRLILLLGTHASSSLSNQDYVPWFFWHCTSAKSASGSSSSACRLAISSSSMTSRRAPEFLQSTPQASVSPSCQSPALEAGSQGSRCKEILIAVSLNNLARRKEDEKSTCAEGSAVKWSCWPLSAIAESINAAWCKRLSVVK